MATRRRKLLRTFYNRPTLKIAEEIIGKHIVYNSPYGRMSARIVEVEAYIGQNDPACHAVRGKTGRNAVMFGKPGFTYIYFIYGMYHCLNFVTEKEGHAAAILLRAAEPDEGIEIMKQNAPHSPTRRQLSGPGKFCRAFGLTRAQNGVDLTGNEIYLEDRCTGDVNIIRTPRIGINHGTELDWRFYDADSEAVSTNKRK